MARQSPPWGSSTPEHAQKRCRGKEMDKRLLVQKSLTLSFRSERNVSPSSFSCFLFFFVARFLVGENTSLLPCGSNTSSAQGTSGKRGADLLTLFGRRDVYHRQTLSPLRKLCQSEGVLCLSSRQQRTNPAIADKPFLATCWCGRLPQPGKGKVFSS